MKQLTKIVLVGLLATFTLGQLQRIQLTPTIAFYLHEVLMIWWLGLSIFTQRSVWLSTIQTLIPPRWVVLMGSWVLFGLLLNTALGGLPFTSWLYTARSLTYILVGWSLTLTSPFTAIQRRMMWTLAGLTMASLGLLQYLFVPDTRFLSALGWDYHYYRLIGTQLDPNFTGILLVISMYFLLSLPRINRLISLTLTCIFLITIALTFSRSTYLSLIVSAFSLAMSHPHFMRTFKKHFWLLMIGGGIVLLVIPKPGGEGVNLFRTYSLEQRIESSVGAIQHLKPYQWIIGKGLFAPTTASTAHAYYPNHAVFPDNLLSFLITNLGVVGFLGAMVLLIHLGKHLRHQDPQLLAAYVAIIVHSMFNHTLFQPFVLLMFLGGLSSLGPVRKDSFVTKD